MQHRSLRGWGLLQHRLHDIVLRVQRDWQCRDVLASDQRYRGSKGRVQSLWLDLRPERYVWVEWHLLCCACRHDGRRLHDHLFGLYADQECLRRQGQLQGSTAIGINPIPPRDVAGT